MTKLFTSEAAGNAMKEVLEHNTIVRTTDTFEVFAVPESLTQFSAYALLVFQPECDFAEGQQPTGTMIIPVMVKNRKGYFIDREVAQTYS